MVKLLVLETGDETTRENMERIEDYLNGQSVLRGEWKFFEITITSAVTNYRYAHKLGFKPKDVIQTSLTGAGTLTWNYSLFNSTHLDITTTDACVVRCFIGTYKENG